jgi:hypothetical protein
LSGFVHPTLGRTIVRDEGDEGDDDDDDDDQFIPGLKIRGTHPAGFARRG